MRESIPYPLVRVGDVIEDLGQVAVVTRTQGAQAGQAGRIESVCVDGQWRETVYPFGAPSGAVSRLGEGCTPSAKGLQDFLAQHPLERLVAG